MKPISFVLVDILTPHRLTDKLSLPLGTAMHNIRINLTQTYSERIAATRRDLRQLVQDSLRKDTASAPSLDLIASNNATVGAATAEPNAEMRWTRRAYMGDVVARYSVRIEGWPLDDVPFKDPSENPNLRMLELLRRRWTEGTVHFRPISESELQEMMEDPSPWIGMEMEDEEI